MLKNAKRDKTGLERCKATSNLAKLVNKQPVPIVIAF